MVPARSKSSIALALPACASLFMIGIVVLGRFVDLPRDFGRISALGLLFSVAAGILIGVVHSARQGIRNSRGGLIDPGDGFPAVGAKTLPSGKPTAPTWLTEVPARLDPTTWGVLLGRKRRRDGTSRRALIPRHPSRSPFAIEPEASGPWPPDRANPWPTLLERKRRRALAADEARAAAKP